MSMITGMGWCGQEKRYWAKMTKFQDGGFEFSFVQPKIIPEVQPLASGSPVYKQGPRQVRPDLTESEELQKQESNRARSVRRARQAVRHKVKELTADHMLTFSYRENMEDMERVKADWQKFLRMMRGKYPRWQFVCIREKQERGAYHLHVAVKGRQDIRWILRCWLLAIGQDWEEVQQWYIYDHHLGAKSLGAVNVRAPSKRWGGKGQSWRPERLAGYLTKYLAKEFAEAEHHSKRYWHSKEIGKPEVVKFWLGSTSFEAAIQEAHDYVYQRGANNLSMWAADDWHNLWISGSGFSFDLRLLPVAASVLDS